MHLLHIKALKILLCFSICAVVSYVSYQNLEVTLITTVRKFIISYLHQNQVSFRVSDLSFPYLTQIVHSGTAT